MYFYVLTTRTQDSYVRMKRSTISSNVQISAVCRKQIADSYGSRIGDVLAYRCRGSLLGFVKMYFKTNRTIYIQDGEIYLW